MGTYSSVSSATSKYTCTNCSSVSSSKSGEGSSTCHCNAGYSGPDLGPCEPCQQGKFKDIPGSAPCSDCPADTYLRFPGASSPSACMSCPPGSNSLPGSSALKDCACLPGYTGADGGPCAECGGGKFKESRGSGECTPCEHGKFSNETTATSEGSCESCPEGETTQSEGSTSQGDCDCKNLYSRDCASKKCTVISFEPCRAILKSCFRMLMRSFVLFWLHCRDVVQDGCFSTENAMTVLRPPPATAQPLWWDAHRARIWRGSARI